MQHWYDAMVTICKEIYEKKVISCQNYFWSAKCNRIFHCIDCLHDWNYKNLHVKKDHQLNVYRIRVLKFKLGRGLTVKARFLYAGHIHNSYHDHRHTLQLNILTLLFRALYHPGLKYQMFGKWKHVFSITQYTIKRSFYLSYYKNVRAKVKCTLQPI